LTRQFTAKRALTFKRKKGEGHSPRKGRKVEVIMKKGLVVILAGLLPFSTDGAPLKGVISAGVLKGKPGPVEGALTGKVKEGGVELNLAVGSLLTPTVLNPKREGLKGNFGLNGDDRFGILWSSVKLKPTQNLAVEGGILTTLVGVELPLTAQNHNTLFGLLWSSQPFIYRGVRLYHYEKPLTFYAEAGREGRALGLLKAQGKTQFGVNLFAFKEGRNLVDLSAGRSSGRFSVIVNLNYHYLRNSPSKRALGGALYLNCRLSKKLFLPLRLEAVKDFKNSGVYGLPEATYSTTFSPTYRLNQKTFLRGEIAAVRGGKRETATVLEVSSSF